VVRVWKVPVESLLKGGLGPLPLAPLSAVTEVELPGVIARMQQRVAAEATPALARELWTAAYVLMGLRYQRGVIDQLLRGVIDMVESVTYQGIIEEGMAKGLAQGMTQGELQEARKNLLLVGTKRLGAAPKAASAAVEAIGDLVKLEQLLLDALDVKSWEELLGLPAKRTRRKSS